VETRAISTGFHIPLFYSSCNYVRGVSVYDKRTRWTDAFPFRRSLSFRSPLPPHSLYPSTADSPTLPLSPAPYPLTHVPTNPLFHTWPRAPLTKLRYKPSYLLASKHTTPSPPPPATVPHTHTYHQKLHLSVIPSKHPLHPFALSSNNTSVFTPPLAGFA